MHTNTFIATALTAIAVAVMLSENLLLAQAEFNMTLFHTAETFSQLTAVDASNNPCAPINGSYFPTAGESGPCLGGMDRSMGVLEEVRAYSPNRTMVVSAGGIFTNSLFWIVNNSRATAPYYKEMGYQAISLDIYSFLTQLEFLAAFAAILEPEIKFVASNLYNVSANPALSNVTVYPYVIVEMGGELVAYTSTLIEDIAKLFRDPGPINSFNEVEAMLATVGTLENMGINKIITSISSSTMLDSVVQSVPGIDVVILPDAFFANNDSSAGGWRLPEPTEPSGAYPQILHMPWDQPLVVVASGSYGRDVGVLNLTFNDNGVIMAAWGNSVQLSDRAPSNPKVYAQVQSDYAGMIDSLGAAIGEAAVAIQYQEECTFAECAVGDWAAEAMRSTGKTQLGLLNGGSIYGGISKGPITLGEILQQFPFSKENPMSTLGLAGVDLVAALEHSVSLANDTSLGINDDIGRFLQISGLRFTWNPDQPVGWRVVDVWVEDGPGQWELLKYGKVYNITTLGFTVNGGDYYTTFMDKGVDIINTNILLINSLQSAVERTLPANGGTPLNVTIDGRIAEVFGVSRITCFSDPANSSFICSGNGYCYNGSCTCTTPGTDGQYCLPPSAQSGESGGLSTGGAIGVAVGSMVAVFCVALVIVFVLALTIRHNRLTNRQDDWVVSVSELELGELLGRGGYGEVYRGRWKGTDVAVKFLPQDVSRAATDSFASEARTMSRLRHPNVVLFMGACVRKPDLCIIMEFMELGTLFDLIHNELVSDIPFVLSLKLMHQAAKGMHFLHSSGIVHRDLKSPNLLLNRQWNLKVADFGLTVLRADPKDGKAKQQGELAGSLMWMAPELLAEYDKVDYMMSDIYSFGIVMWEVLTRSHPYAGLTQAQIAVGVIRDGLRPTMKDNDDGDSESSLEREERERKTAYKNLVRECWHTDSHMRPVFGDVMRILGEMIEGRTHSSVSGTSTSSDTVSSSTSQHKAASSVTMNSMLEEITSGSPSNGSSPYHHGAGLYAKVPREDVCYILCDLMDMDQAWEEDSKEAEGLVEELSRMVHGLAKHHALHIFSTSEFHSGGTFFMSTGRAIDALGFTADLLTQALQGGTIVDHLRVSACQKPGHSPALRGDQLYVSYALSNYEEACRLNVECPAGFVICSESFRQAALAVQADRALALRFVPFGSIDGHRRHVSAYRVLPPNEDEVVVETLREIPAREAKGTNFDDGNEEVQEGELQESDIFHAAKGRGICSSNSCRWIIERQKLTLGECIGQGSYGQVYRGDYVGMPVAIKQLYNRRLDERTLRHMRLEAALLYGLEHPNIVRLIGLAVDYSLAAHTSSTISGIGLALVMELVEGGTNLRQLLSARNKPLSWLKRMGLLRNAALGIAYIHQHGFIHRDLKSSNLMVSADGMNIQVADFGFVTIKQENNTMTRCGTPAWTAPELMQPPSVDSDGPRASEKVDIYSFGIVMWEVLTRRLPYDTAPIHGLVMRVLEGDRPPIPSDCPSNFADMMTRCWNADPSCRPSMDELVHFFNKELEASPI